LLRHLGCLLLGALVSLASLLVHRSLLPLGLLAALAASYAVPLWLLRSSRPRTAGSYVIGWLAVLVVAVVGRPEGDYVVAGDVPGYLLLAGGFGLIVVALVSFAGGRSSSP
jgi:hypothetical protein